MEIYISMNLTFVSGLDLIHAIPTGTLSVSYEIDFEKRKNAPTPRKISRSKH